MSDVCTGDEGYALLLHYLDFPVNYVLFQLHVGNPVHEESSYSVFPLEYSHIVSPLVKLIGGSQAGRPGSYHGNPFVGAQLRRPGTCLTGLVCFLDYGIFVFLDRHRIPVQSAGTGCLAGRRADPAGELREAVGLFQAIICLSPIAAVHQIIPLRHQIVQRASGHHSV